MEHPTIFLKDTDLTYLNIGEVLLDILLDEHEPLEDFLTDYRDYLFVENCRSQADKVAQN